MNTRKEWQRQRLRKKYGKFFGGFIALGILLGLAAVTGIVLFILHLNSLRAKSGDQADGIQAAAQTAENEAEPEKEPEEKPEAVSTPKPTPTPAPTPEPEPEGFRFEKWKAEHTKVKGIYVTGPVAGSDRMRDMVELIDATELNAMVIDIKNDAGEITFKMPEDKMPAAIGSCVRYIRDMDALMADLKSHEIYTIARIVCFKDPLLAAARPDLALRETNGKAIVDANNLAWVNPCSEEVWAYLTDIAIYCAELGFDEVQFDYVRFPVGKGTENADYGVVVTPENKHEYISKFLKYAADRLHEKEIPITADLFGTVIGNPTDVQNVGQDYAELASTVDVLCPMIYPSHYGKGVFGLEVPDAKPYETIVGALGRSVESLSAVDEKERAVVRPWLQAFTAPWVDGYISYGIDEIRKQIQGVYDAGYDEWILWNAKNNYSMLKEE
ncbi:MAG: putative glycoside hydrolase [Lachnospiraceae bacterium]|nr:putative glycoside hydrolase [Lachnospiraceae bacterium]